MSTRIGQRRHVRTVIPVVSALFIAVAVGAVGVRMFHQSHASAAGVAVSGNRLTLDGTPFVPLGFTMVGLLSPPGCNDGVGVAARNHLNQNEMDVAKNDWHANTLRYQISYNGLTGYTAAQRTQYLQQIQDAVTLSRKNGFVVILSLQDQGVGCGPARALPPIAANDVWTTLANTFKSNPYVLFELWNEPTNLPNKNRLATTDPNYSTNIAWPDWLNGRATAITSDKWDAYIPTGHQNLVDSIRKTGATNVLMADGANHSEHLEGMPLLTDSLKPEQIAYAPHMYYFQTSRADWNTRFGYLMATKPVVVTEWNMDCGNDTQANMQADFFSYLTDNHVGLTAWGLDFMDTLINDWSYTATSTANCASKTPATNAGGAVTKAYFTNYKGNPSPGPTPTPPAPPPPPPGDTSPPTVSITAPASLTTVVLGTVVPITAAASDNVKVTKVIVYVDGTAIATMTTSPYSVNWTATVVGTHSITAQAYDAAGNMKAATAVSLSVVGQTGALLPGDVNGDKRVNAVDLSSLLSHDGQNYPAADFNHDGTVGAADMAILLAHWTW